MPDAGLKRRWVVGADVVIYGCIAHESLSPEVQTVAIQCVSFLSRAAYHGAELHVPFVFYSEVMTLAARAVAQGVTDWDTARQLMSEAFATTWEFHIPAWDDVLELHPRLNMPASSNTHDAEYLAVARDVETAVITTRSLFKQRVEQNDLEIPVIFIGDHPWGLPGSLDAHPPTND